MSLQHPSEEQLSLLLDGEISLTAREAVLAHLRACPGCAERHDQLIETAAALRLADPLSWSQAQTEATLDRLHTDRRARRLLRGRRRDWSVPAGAAIAALAIAAALLAPLGLGATLATAPRSAAAVLSLVLPVSGRVLAYLGVAVALGALSYPLSRSR